MGGISYSDHRVYLNTGSKGRASVDLSVCGGLLSFCNGHVEHQPPSNAHYQRVQTTQALLLFVCHCQPLPLHSIYIATWLFRYQGKQSIVRSTRPFRYSNTVPYSRIQLWQPMYKRPARIARALRDLQLVLQRHGALLEEAKVTDLVFK